MHYIKFPPLLKLFVSSSLIGRLILESMEEKKFLGRWESGRVWKALAQR